MSFLQRFIKRFNYIDYWNTRYQTGQNSGEGSYGLLAEFKSEIINQFIKDHEVDSVIEFGCGDGHNLALMQYNSYLGLDVAESSIKLCSNKFAHDRKKSFILYNPECFYNKGFFKADLVVCLDVLYHIIPEQDFLKTLNDIFSCAGKFVILYTTTTPEESNIYASGQHIKHRDTVEYLEKLYGFKIEKIIPPKYPDKSLASFIFLRRHNLSTENKMV